MRLSSRVACIVYSEPTVVVATLATRSSLQPKTRDSSSVNPSDRGTRASKFARGELNGSRCLHGGAVDAEMSKTDLSYKKFNWMIAQKSGSGTMPSYAQTVATNLRSSFEALADQVRPEVAVTRGGCLRIVWGRCSRSLVLSLRCSCSQSGLSREIAQAPAYTASHQQWSNASAELSCFDGYKTDCTPAYREQEKPGSFGHAVARLAALRLYYPDALSSTESTPHTRDAVKPPCS